MARGKRWQPGQSGNPAGRPKGKGFAAAIRKRTRNGLEMIEHALTVMRDKDAPIGEQQRAREFLTDRAFGKATQHTVTEAELTAELKSSNVVDMERFTPIERELLTQLVRRAADREAAGEIVDGSTITELPPALASCLMTVDGTDKPS
ncbi:MAG: DUF5681 domain-containing protein [Myxococcaceae bacterium]